MTIKKGDKVKLNNFKDIGVVEMVDSGILIVKLSDKTLIKCLERDVTPVEDEIKSDQITITREDFRNALMNAIDPDKLADNFKDMGEIMMVGLSAMLVVKDMEVELFGELPEND